MMDIDIFDLLSGLPVPLTFLLFYFWVKLRDLIKEEKFSRISREKIHQEIQKLKEFKAVSENEFKNINENLTEIKQQLKQISEELKK